MVKGTMDGNTTARMGADVRNDAKDHFGLCKTISGQDRLSCKLGERIREGLGLLPSQSKCIGGIETEYRRSASDSGWRVRLEAKLDLSGRGLVRLLG